MNLKKPFFIVIYGPTAVGKSDFAELLAQHIPAEIINADVGQFYTPLTIGTAKPAWRHSSIPHHLFDCEDNPVNITVVEYRNRVVSLMKSMMDRGNIPLIVGGSTFYIKNIFFPIGDMTLKEDQYLKPSWDQLYAIDPDRALAIHKHDTYRIARALAIWRATGKKPSTFQVKFQPPSDYMVIALSRNRDQLYARINERVRQMIAQGWVEEVCALQGTAWEPFLQQKKIIGYDDLLVYCKDRLLPLEPIIARIAQRTRHYAKRQIIFEKLLLRQLEQAQRAHPEYQGTLMSANLTLTDLTLYINQLSKQILTFIQY